MFNPGDHVEGYTSFLWTVFMAPWTVAPADIVWFSIAFGVVASGISLWAVAAHVRAAALRRRNGVVARRAAAMTALDGSHAVLGDRRARDVGVHGAVPVGAVTV